MEEFFAAVRDAKMRIWGQLSFMPEGLMEVLDDISEERKNKSLSINILVDKKLKDTINKNNKDKQKEHIYRVSESNLYDTYFIVDEDSFVYSSLLNKFSKHPNITEKDIFQLYWGNAKTL